MADRITAKNVQNVAENLLGELKAQGHVPADAVLSLTRSEPAYGITWGVRIVQDLNGRHERTVGNVLERALDGITSAREAWLILDATLRTLRYYRTAPIPPLPIAEEHGTEELGAPGGYPDASIPLPALTINGVPVQTDATLRRLAGETYGGDVQALRYDLGVVMDLMESGA